MHDAAPIVNIEASLHSLSEALDRSKAENDRLRERLDLIVKAELNHIDGDFQHDGHHAEIVGIAIANPDWLKHAKETYDMKHAELVQFGREMFERINDQIGFGSTAEHIAHVIADVIEERILPAMVLAEDGRTFLRSQGKPYPREVEKAS